jgi:hypothetical protein
MVALVTTVWAVRGPAEPLAAARYSVPNLHAKVASLFRNLETTQTGEAMNRIIGALVVCAFVLGAIGASVPSVRTAARGSDASPVASPMVAPPRRARSRPASPPASPSTSW